MSGVRLCHFSTLPLRIHDFKWSGATIPLPDVPKPQTGNIVGTVTDVNDDTVPGATVVLDCPVQTDPRTVVTNGNRFFEFKDVEPGTTYHVTVSAQGFANWTSPAVILKPGQYAILTGSKLQIAEGSPQSLWLLRLPPPRRWPPSRSRPKSSNAFSASFPISTSSTITTPHRSPPS